jgi:MSHA biogenesis protein MshO
MNESPRILIQRMAGFTLVEAVMVIVITGILAGIVAVFIVTPVKGYFDSVRRADLTDAADTALKRIARDVRTALPNSLRAPNPANSCFEFLPTVGGGRYRAAQSNTATGTPFDFTTANAFSFDVLADNGLGSLPAGTNNVVVYNLGISGADAYNNDNRRSISSVTGTSPTMTIALNAGNRFPFESPGRRFHVIPNVSVAYSCSGGNLYRQTQAISALQIACPAAGTILVSNVSSCVFTYTQAISQRNGLLTMTLVLTDASGESVRLYDEVHVNNAP